MMDACYIVEYDKLDYRKALKMQEQIRRKKEKDRNFDNFLMLLQHDPVFTLGKKGKREEIIVSDKVLKDEGIDVVCVQRGGKVTYHGPGQLVAYFLLDLIQLKIDIPDFVWKMEETIIKTISSYGLEGQRREGFPGVWVIYGETWVKIAAVGARASKRITSHGLALNVNTNLTHFQMIVPCGIREYEPISMEKILGKKLNIQDIYRKYEKSFEDVFKLKLRTISKKDFQRRCNRYA